MLRLHAALGWRTVLPVHGAAMPSSHDHSKPGRPTGTREAWIEMLHEDRGDLDSVLQELWVANYYSARNPLRLSSLVILGVVARMFRCATRSSCWCT